MYEWSSDREMTSVDFVSGIRDLEMFSFRDFTFSRNYRGGRKWTGAKQRRRNVQDSRETCFLFLEWVPFEVPVNLKRPCQTRGVNLLP